MSVAPPPWSYRWRLIALLWPALFLHTLIKGIKARSGGYILQRFGLCLPRNSQPALWVHCASVGEVNTALALIATLQKQFLQLRCLVTSHTVTSASIIRRLNNERIAHCYLPIESRALSTRLIKAINPIAVLIVETELWPMLFHSIKRQRIPLVMVNARLSHKTMHANKPWLRASYRYCLSQVDHVYCRSQADAEKYLTLGVAPARLETLGNLKYAGVKASSQASENIIRRPYVALISSHHDEELQLAKAWRKSHSTELLLIAPRHPQRGDKIATTLRRHGWELAQRSRQEAIKPTTQIYLADTIGEITRWIGSARWVFVGGSLIPHGGHNILEVARSAKAILCGPYMDNFSEETSALVKTGAAMQLSTTAELEDAIITLRAPYYCDTMGQKGQRFLRQHEQVIVDYSQRLSILLAPRVGRYKRECTT